MIKFGFSEKATKFVVLLTRASCSVRPTDKTKSTTRNYLIIYLFGKVGLKLSPASPFYRWDLQNPTRRFVIVSLLKFSIHIRCLMVSTDQADSRCFCFMNIDWMTMILFYFCPLNLVQGLRSLEHRLLQKLSMKNFDQKFRFFIK